MRATEGLTKETGICFNRALSVILAGGLSFSKCSHFGIELSICPRCATHSVELRHERFGDKQQFQDTCLAARLLMMPAGSDDLSDLTALMQLTPKGKPVDFIDAVEQALP